jgi:hypothetical protein
MMAVSAASYPNMPVYPVGQREVTVLQTGQAPYEYCNNKFREAREGKLVVYELLVRDFDA